MEQQMGQRNRELLSPPHNCQAQAGVCSRTPTTWSFPWYWQDILSLWETLLSSVSLRHS